MKQVVEEVTIEWGRVYAAEAFATPARDIYPTWTLDSVEAR
jgi:hypothetical protein